jgi:hypothetical protein
VTRLAKKLSKKMITAIKDMANNGEYEMWELPYWNLWQSVTNHGVLNIRTDTMKALENRGLVKSTYNPKRKLWKWTAVLTDQGLELSKNL